MKRKTKTQIYFVVARNKRPYACKVYETQRDGLFELRMEYNGNIFRIFFIFDGDKIVVLFNGFQKKTQKTPLGEIEKALKLKNEYYGHKQSFDNKHK